jgi:hypothetical protein
MPDLNDESDACILDLGALMLDMIKHARKILKSVCLMQ